MASLVLAARLNNTAVNQMGSDCSQAIPTLAEALSSVRAAIAKAAIGETDSLTATNASMHVAHDLLHFASSAQTMTTEASIASQEEWYNDCFIFESPIKINDARLLSLPRATGDYVHLITYAIIYNLGLCYHLQAVHYKTNGLSGTGAKTLLLRAVTLYNQAHALVFKKECQRSAESRTSIALDGEQMLLHAMVMNNNLGHAHHLLNDSRSARLHFRGLVQSIMVMHSFSDKNGATTEAGQRQADRTRLPWLMTSEGRSCLDGFLANVLKLLLNGLPPLAPAA